MKDLAETARELERLLRENSARISPAASQLAQVRVAGDDALAITIEKAALERTLLEVATREAGKHGIKISDLTLSLTAAAPRVCDLEVNLRAQKMFFATTIRISGRVMLAENLALGFSDLRCAGEGAIGAVACGFLAPKLKELESQAIALADLSLGELRLRDLQWEVGDRITLTAFCQGASA